MLVPDVVKCKPSKEAWPAIWKENHERKKTIEANRKAEEEARKLAKAKERVQVRRAIQICKAEVYEESEYAPLRMMYTRLPDPV